MKRFLFLTAIIETLAGLGALIAPAIAGRLLLAADVSSASPLVRICGAALLALGAACWLGAGDAPSRSARRLSLAMLVYNVGAVIVLAASGILTPPVGVALWPAVVLHAAMTAWCVTVLMAKPTEFAR